MVADLKSNLRDTSLKVRTITIGEESGTTSAGYAGTIHNKTETNLAFQIGGSRHQQICQCR